MVGFTCCGEMGELATPDNCAVPRVTVIACPPTTTFASTGEGGRPPPVNVLDRAPPHDIPFAAMPPDALNRLSQYPRASPSEVEHEPCAAGMGLLVENATIPAAMMAELTVCSSFPF